MALRGRPLLATFAIAALVAGCGGGDGGDEGDSPGTAPSGPAIGGTPQAKERVGQVTDRVDQAISGDCDARAEIFLHSGHKGRGEPLEPSADQCAKYEEVAGFLSGWKATDSREYGTGAVSEGKTDGTSGGEYASIVWALDKDGAWKGIYFATSRTPQIGQEPPPGADFDTVADDFYRAARDRDCGALFRVLAHDSQYVTARDNDRERFCADLRTAYDAGTGQLFDIAEHGSKPPQRLGQTRDLAFYALELDNGRYITVVVTAVPKGEDTKGHDNPAVYDFLTARDPR